MASKSFLALALGAALLLAGPTGFGPAEAFAQACLPQSEVRAAVASGVPPLSVYLPQLRSRGEVVSSCLARQGNSYIYVVGLLQGGGQVTTIRFNANTGP
jgi:hypothetical protein